MRSRRSSFGFMMMAGLVISALVAGCATSPTAPAQGSAPSAPAQTQAPKTPIKIGVSAPLSGSVASIGQDFKEATTLAVEEINGKGGVLGRPLELVFGDNECNPATGVNAVGNLIDVHKVAAVLGSSCSSVTLAVMPVVERAGIVQLEAGGTNPKITSTAGKGGNQWQFRVNIDDSIMAKAFSAMIAEEVKSVVLVGSNDDYGRGAAQAFQENLTPKGVKVLSTEYYTRGQSDYRPMVTKIKSLNPEGIIVIADAPDAAPFALQATELGLTNVKVYGRGTVVTPEFQTLVKDPKIWNGAKEVNRWAPTGSQFEKDYEKKYGRVPRVTGALPYYGIYVLAEAIKIAGSDDRTAIRDALRKVSLSFPELGAVKFDDYHQAHPDMFITQWDNGTIKTLVRRKTE